MVTKDPKSCIVSAVSIRSYIPCEAIERWRYMSIRIFIYFLRLKIMTNHDERRNSRCRCINKPLSKGLVHRSKVFDLELSNLV